MREPLAGSEVRWRNLQGTAVQPGVGRGERFDNYCCYSETQIAGTGEGMMENHLKTTKTVTTGTRGTLGRPGLVL